MAHTAVIETLIVQLPLYRRCGKPEPQDPLFKRLLPGPWEAGLAGTWVGSPVQVIVRVKESHHQPTTMEAPGPERPARDCQTGPSNQISLCLRWAPWGTAGFPAHITW